MSNVVYLPSAVNPLDRLSRAVCALSSLVAQCQAEASREEGFGFSAAEGRIRGAVGQVEIAALADVLTAAQPQSTLIEVHGEVYKRMSQTATVEYLALPGVVEIERALYRRVDVRNGPTVDAIALRCGLVEGRMTPGAAVGFAHLSQAVPSREAAELCASLGVLPYSRSALHRNALAVGKAWDEQAPFVHQELMQATEIPSNAAAVSVSVDRVSLPMAEDRPRTELDRKRGVLRPISVEFRMAYCAVWTLHDAEGEPLHSVRYAHIPDWGAEMMEASLVDDLRALLQMRPDLKLVTLADGAPEMQQLLDRVVAALGVQVEAQMVDFWHVTEKLAAAARAAGKPVKETTHRFARELLKDDNAIDAIEDELLGWAAATEGDELPEELYDALVYIENQHHRLRYASARARGLPIGSGHVEATCKTIVSVRFKRAGARWRPGGAQPLLRLRALATSSRWIPAMKLLTDSYVVQVCEAA